jgi:hypothetical protein
LKAAGRVEVFIVSTFTRPVGDVQVGDRVRLSGLYRTVIAVSTDEYGVRVTVDKPLPSGCPLPASDGIIYQPTSTIVILPMDWREQVIAYARTITRGVTVIEGTRIAPTFRNERSA